MLNKEEINVYKSSSNEYDLARYNFDEIVSPSVFNGLEINFSKIYSYVKSDEKEWVRNG